VDPPADAFRAHAHHLALVAEGFPEARMILQRETDSAGAATSGAAPAARPPQQRPRPLCKVGEGGWTVTVTLTVTVIVTVAVPVTVTVSVTGTPRAPPQQRAWGPAQGGEEDGGRARVSPCLRLGLAQGAPQATSPYGAASYCTVLLYSTVLYWPVLYSFPLSPLQYLSFLQPGPDQPRLRGSLIGRTSWPRVYHRQRRVWGAGLQAQAEPLVLCGPRGQAPGAPGPAGGPGVVAAGACAAGQGCAGGGGRYGHAEAARGSASGWQ